MKIFRKCRECDEEFEVEFENDDRVLCLSCRDLKVQSRLGVISPKCSGSGHPRFYELVEHMREIHSKKNQDYGGGDPLGNFRGTEKLGVSPFLGCLVRMTDKWERICNLVSKDGVAAVEDETITDTLIDLANYSVLAVVMWEEGLK